MDALIRALQLDLALRIAVAFLLGATIGVERERWSKAAGLRTHMLVAGGAAIFTVSSPTSSGKGAGRTIRRASPLRW